MRLTIKPLPGYGVLIEDRKEKRDGTQGDFYAGHDEKQYECRLSLQV